MLDGLLDASYLKATDSHGRLLCKRACSLSHGEARKIGVRERRGRSRFAACPKSGPVGSTSAAQLAGAFEESLPWEASTAPNITLRGG